MDPQPAPLPDWNAEADKILSFIRKQQLVVSLDEGVWVYGGSAESQLAGFIRDLDASKKAKSKRRLP